MLIDNKYVGWVYLITNKKTRQLYVGQTMRTVHQRFKQHVYNKNGDTRIDCELTVQTQNDFNVFAIDKIIADTSDECRQKLKEREVYWIEHINTYKNYDHYNLTPGGDSVSGIIQNPVLLYDLSGSLINSFDSMTEAADYIGLKGSSRISECCKKRDQYLPIKGKYIVRCKDDPLTEIDIQNIRLLYPRYIQYSLDGEILNIFNHPNDVINYYKKQHIQLTRSELACITGKEHRRNGYFNNSIWRKEPDQFEDLPLPRFLSYKRVEQRDAETGELINIFKNGIEAANQLQISYLCINGCCRNTKTATNGFTHGFYFCYEGDFNFDKFQYKKSQKPRSDEVVYQFDIYGNFIREYRNLHEASNLTNIAEHNIWRVCTQRRNMASGFIWRYKSDVEDIQSFKDTLDKNKYMQWYPVYQFDLDGNYIDKYKDVADASKQTGLIASRISEACKHKYAISNMYFWMYEIDITSIKDTEKELKEYLKVDKHRKHIESLQRQSVCKGIGQYTLDNQFVARFNSISEASHSTKIPYAQIYDTCKHKQKTCRGYKWEYLY